MQKFKLVNPVITGTFSNTYEAETPEEAAKKFWEALTSDNKNITGNVPQFMFTMQGGASDELYHFKIHEKPSGSTVEYHLERIYPKITDTEMKEFLLAAETAENSAKTMVKQSGGKKRYETNDDDSSDSSSSGDDVDDLFKYIRMRSVTRPIVYWWYAPTLYKINTVFTPNFVAPISPYVQLWVPMK